MNQLVSAFQNEICHLYQFFFLCETATKQPVSLLSVLIEHYEILNIIKNSVSVFLKLEVLLFSMKVYRERKNNSKVLWGSKEYL